ncbi:MAG: 2-phospho-L-lactate guanylyltransferase [Acidimicrobiia bacterium]
MQPGRRTHSAGVVIPIRAFRSGKARLASALDDDARADLARMMADRVVDAAGALPVLIVSSAAEVRAWAAERGLGRVDDPGRGLDGAAAAGLRHLAERGAVRVVVAHADLPWARPGALERFSGEPSHLVSMVPCHRDDGTPVLSVPVVASFTFAYGSGSFRRHAATARALGLAVRVVRDPELGHDVDIPDDLAAISELTA